jgi:hypothetical protein
MGQSRGSYRVGREILRKRHHLENLGVDQMIIYNWILNKYEVMVGGRGLKLCGSGQSKLQAVLNMTMYLQVPKNLRIFLTK